MFPLLAFKAGNGDVRLMVLTPSKVIWAPLLVDTACSMAARKVHSSSAVWQAPSLKLSSGRSPEEFTMKEEAQEAHKAASAASTNNVLGPMGSSDFMISPLAANSATCAK